MRYDEDRAGLRCKPGDLAIVTKCSVKERIGLLVRVVERHGGARFDWLTELLGPGVVARDLNTGRVCRCTSALMHDWNLTPISGLDLPRQMCRPEDESANQRP